MTEMYTFVDYAHEGIDLSQLGAPIEHPDYDFKLEDHPEVLQQFEQYLKSHNNLVGSRTLAFEDLDEDNK